MAREDESDIDDSEEEDNSSNMANSESSDDNDPAEELAHRPKVIPYPMIRILILGQ